MAQTDSDLSLGGHLRSLREAKGFSLDEMAHATKVSVRQLDALESDRVAELPAPVFVRGFVRAYCDALGDAPDEALRRYGRMPAPPPPSERGASSARRAPASAAGPIALSFALLLVFGIGLFAINAFLRREGRLDAPAPPRTAGATTASAPPAPSNSAAPAPRPVAAATSADFPREGPRPQRLLVRAMEATWIRIQVDAGRVEEELLAAGTTREWSADKRFLLTVGNAGGIEIQLNGQTIPPLGGRGVVIRQLELPRAAAGS